MNERPGVYTAYEVASVLAGKGSGGAVGIAAQAASGTAMEAVVLTTYAQAASAFGTDCNLTKLIKILIQNGAPKIVAVPVKIGEDASSVDYEAAFGILMTHSQVKYMVCDSRDGAVHMVQTCALPIYNRLGLGKLQISCGFCRAIRDGAGLDGGSRGAQFRAHVPGGARGSLRHGGRGCSSRRGGRGRFVRSGAPPERHGPGISRSVRAVNRYG